MRLNTYTCTTCKKEIVTREIHEGTTSFMLKCRATEGCPGKMESAFYSRIPANIKPTWEWYRRNDIENMGPEELDHHTKGGLFIRKINDEDRNAALLT